MMDQRAEDALARIAGEIDGLFGTELLCLVLYGSGAGRDFVPGKSDLNLAIVLRNLRFEHLQLLHGKLAAWHALGAAMPLILDPATLARSCDVFPMEWQDIQDTHRLLRGHDVFADLTIRWDHLRDQAEHEVRGKQLRLHALFAEVGAEYDRLQPLLLDSVKTFLIVMRSLLRLRHKQRTSSYTDVLAAFEQTTQHPFPTMHQLLRIKLHEDVWPRTIEPIVRSYFEEVANLVGLVDEFPHAA